MRIYSLKSGLAVGIMLGLFAALLTLKERLSYRPITINISRSVPLQSPPQLVPIVWHGKELWVQKSGDWKIGWWDMSSFVAKWKTVRNWDRSLVPLTQTSRGESETLTLNPARNEGALTSARTAKIDLWHGKKRVRSFKEEGHRNRINLMRPTWPRLLSLSPDGKLLVADSRLTGYSEYNEVKRGFCAYGLALFDTQTGRQMVRHSAIEGCFADVTWSPSSRELAAITEDGWVYVLNGQSGKLRLKFRAHQPFGAQIAWSPDGKTLVTATNPRIGNSPTGLAFDFKSGVSVMNIGNNGKHIIDGGRTIITTDSKGDTTINGRTERLVKRFDASTGNLLGWPVTLETGATDLAFSPDGKHLALGEHDFALILDAETLAIERRLSAIPPQNTTTVSVPVCVAWSPDGATLATSTYNTIKLWRTR